MSLVTNIRVNVDAPNPADESTDDVNVTYLVDTRSPSVTKKRLRTGGAADLVSATAQGEVNAFAATPNTVMVSNGVTPGMVPTSLFALGTPMGVFHAEDPAFGAVADGATVTDGTTVATDATLTSASNPWVAADVGKPIRVRGAGAAGADHVTTIASFTSAGSIEMTDVAVTSVAGTATVDWGTDNSVALQAMLTACKAAGGGVCQLSTGVYMVTANLGLTSATGVTVRGMGMGASTIRDLRADDNVGAFVTEYAGLLSYVDCVSCNVMDLTIRGPVHVVQNTGLTANFGRKGTMCRRSPNCHVVRVEACYIRDEAIYCDTVPTDTPPSHGWMVYNCRLHHFQTNGINGAGHPTSGVIVAENYIEDIGCGDAINLGCESFLCLGNVITGLGTGKLGGDGVYLVPMGNGVFGNNVLENTSWPTQGPLHVSGPSTFDGVMIIANNVFRGLSFEANDPTEAACIRVTDDDDPPEGSVFVTGNLFKDIVGLSDAQHRLIWFESCAATFRGYVANNVMIGSDTDFMRVAITTEDNAAGAKVYIGPNMLDGWITEYNDLDGSMVFAGSTFSGETQIDDGDTPYDVLPTDSLVLCDTTGGVLTVTLPAVANMKGRHVQIADWGRAADTNTITVAAQGGETINGAASIGITTEGASAYCYCDGTEWKTLAPVS
ncbi:MAG: hypothetical protein WC700_10360 [Gemmatimonadaceae bacterium]|jgi:hypothetical protein